MEGLEPPPPPVSGVVRRVSSSPLPPPSPSSSSVAPAPAAATAIAESTGRGGREWRKAELSGEAREVAGGGVAREGRDGGGDARKRRRGERGREEEEVRLRRKHRGGIGR